MKVKNKQANKRFQTLKIMNIIWDRYGAGGLVCTYIYIYISLRDIYIYIYIYIYNIKSPYTYIYLYIYIYIYLYLSRYSFAHINNLISTDFHILPPIFVDSVFDINFD